jgi:hypothetical protein
MRSFCFRAVLLTLTLPIVACSPGSATSELTGKVTYKGSPLTMGEVYVKSEDGREVSNTINPDGTYTIKNVPRGTLKVRIHCIDEKAYNEYNNALTGRTGSEPRGPDGTVRPKGSKILEASDFAKIPKKYDEYENSGLTVEVKDSKAQKDFVLE